MSHVNFIKEIDTENRYATDRFISNIGASSFALAEDLTAVKKVH